MSNQTEEQESKMNVYEAIMKAADSIEGQPKRFNFESCSYPDCGSPACALGWIGHHLGYRDADRYTEAHNHEGVLFVCAALGLPYERRNHCRNEFYDRMRGLHGDYDWFKSAERVAQLLRLYAAKYHAPEKPRRTDSELVADLMRKISTERIPEGVPA